MTRYWLGARRAFLNCPVVGMSCDEARIGGKSRFYGALMNLQTGMTCWGPPQDSIMFSCFAMITTFIFSPTIVPSSSTRTCVIRPTELNTLERKQHQRPKMIGEPIQSGFYRIRRKGQLRMNQISRKKGK